MVKREKRILTGQSLRSPSLISRLSAGRFRAKSKLEERGEARGWPKRTPDKGTNHPPATRYYIVARSKKDAKKGGGGENKDESVGKNIRNACRSLSSDASGIVAS